MLCGICSCGAGCGMKEFFFLLMHGVFAFLHWCPAQGRAFCLRWRLQRGAQSCSCTLPAGRIWRSGFARGASSRLASSGPHRRGGSPLQGATKWLWPTGGSRSERLLRSCQECAEFVFPPPACQCREDLFCYPQQSVINHAWRISLGCFRKIVWINNRAPDIRVCSRGLLL